MITAIVLILSAGAVMAMLYGASTRPSKPTQLTIDSRPAAIAKPKGLSAVAQEVYGEYMSLPPESRPFDNIGDILKSLDAVTGEPNNDRRDHFDINRERKRGYSSRYSINSYGERIDPYPFKFAWNTGICTHNSCKYSAYYDLHVEIAGVKKALDDKARALVESENAHNVAMAAELVSALREEAGIQREVTKSL